MSTNDDFDDAARLTLALAQSLLGKLPPPDIVAAMLAAVLEFSKRMLGAEDLQQLASDAGLAWRTVRRAQKKLGVKSRKTGKCGTAWQWWHPDALPRDGSQP